MQSSKKSSKTVLVLSIIAALSVLAIFSINGMINHNLFISGENGADGDTQPLREDGPGGATPTLREDGPGGATPTSIYQL